MSIRPGLPVLLGLCLIAACSGSKRDFGSPDIGGSGGDSDGASGHRSNIGGDGNPIADAGADPGTGASSNSSAGSNSNGGASSKAGASGKAGSNGTGASSGTGGGTTSGDGGEAGLHSEPDCGAPTEQCCLNAGCVVGAACSGGTCACQAGLSACANSCLDLTKDQKNCGSCGHDCLGGACDLGVCQPVIIATQQAGLQRVLSDGTYIYWSGYTTVGMPAANVFYIARRKADLSDEVKVIANNEKGARSLVVTPGHLYWMANGHLRVCDAPDCSQGPTDFTATVTCDGSLLYATSIQTLFWGCSGDYPSYTGNVWSLPLSPATPAKVGPNPTAPTVLAQDSANLYWLSTSTYTEGGSLNADGGVWRARLSDQVATQLVSGIRADLGSMAVAGSALYFAGNLVFNASPEAIYRAPLPNGLGAGVLPVYAPAKSVSGLVADSQALYFMTNGSTTGQLLRCPHAASCPTPEKISPDLPISLNLAQDSQSLLWTTYAPGGSIQRLAK